MTRPSLVDDPFIDGNGRPVRATRSDPARAASDYQAVPERQSEYLKQLTLGVLDRIEAMSPFRDLVTRTVLRDDVTQASLGRGGAPSGVDPQLKIAGPASQTVAYWLPRDHTAPTPPADPAWDTNMTDAQPAELIAMATISSEDFGDALRFVTVDSGKAVPDRPDPVIVKHLAEALVRAENVAFAAGAATNADPIRGLANIAGLSTFAATAAPYIDELYTAIAKLRAAKRFVNGAFVGAGLYKILRQAKGSTGGAYLFDPADPIVLDDGGGNPVPVRVLDGIPDGAATVAYVGDFSMMVQTQRIMPNGLLAYVARSDHALFATDQVRFRVTERIDWTLTPNQGPSIYKISGINAVAP